MLQPEHIYNWLDKLPYGYRKIFNEEEKQKAEFEGFIEILKEAIERDPMSGLEFLNDYRGIQFVDIDNWNTINGKPYIKPESKHL